MTLELIPTEVRVLRPSVEGNVLTNGEVFSDEVWIPSDDEAENWREVDNAEAQEIQLQLDQASAQRLADHEVTLAERKQQEAEALEQWKADFVTRLQAQGVIEQSLTVAELLQERPIEQSGDMLIKR